MSLSLLDWVNTISWVLIQVVTTDIIKTVLAIIHKHYNQ